VFGGVWVIVRNLHLASYLLVITCTI